MLDKQKASQCPNLTPLTSRLNHVYKKKKEKRKKKKEKRKKKKEERLYLFRIYFEPSFAFQMLLSGPGDFF